MLKLFSNRYSYILITFLLTFSSGISQAEDTEIYFSSGSASGNSSAAILPNVLLILDTSGSMTASVYDGGTNLGSRMELMKEAMVDIINGVEDVNMGLMRFTYKNGGAIVYPIAGIDDPAGDTVSEPDDSKRTLAYTVGSSSDDAEEELGGNTVTINDAVLNMNVLSAGTGTATAQINTANNDAAQYNNTKYLNWRVYSDQRVLNAFRFTGLNLPAAATITSATLHLTDRDGINASDSGVVTGEKVGTCADYSLESGTGIAARLAGNPTTATTNQTFGVFDPEPIDVTTIISEIHAVGAGVGTSLCLFFQGTGLSARSFHSFDTNSANAPRLDITYSTAVATANQTTGLRFQNVVVPQGATITDAKLILTPFDSDNTTGEKINIYAEAVDDSTTFAATNNNINTGRPLTGAVTTWELPATTQNSAISSCTDGTCTGSSLAAVIQEVTSRAGWCGGNDINLITKTNAGNKDFYSWDGDSGRSAQLEITYDATGTLGCVVDTDTAQIGTGNDDAENTTRSSSDLDFEPGVKVGLRFQDMNVPQGATILSATISITAYTNDSGSDTDITIYGEDEDNTDSYGNVSTRTKTSASVLYEPPSWTTNTVYTTPDLKTIVQEIVDRGGWNDGNAMAFIMETTGSNRRGRTYNDNPTKAARLSITYQSTGGFSPVKTVREKLIELVGELPTSDWTPITEVLYEAAHYWRGDSVVYGKSRDGLSKTRLSHPGSYCEGDNDCGGANTGSYPPYGIYEAAGCTDANLDASACSTRSIQGSPDYLTPFTSELSCASNYQILLTDGEANSANMESTVESEFPGIGQCINTNSTGGSISSSQKCSIDLARYLFEEDQSTVLDNDQTVTTYTVGFNISNQYLKDIATEGGGSFSEASNASDLVTVFDTILTDVKSDPTSIVSPSLATNAFNRLFSRDDVYFGLFTPELNSAWDGNVKKYTVCTEVGILPNCDFVTRILDANDEQAVDATDRFKTSSTSVWSDVVDGIETVMGGVGGEMTDFTDRVIYTETTSSGTMPAVGTDLSNSGYKITSSNWSSTDLATVRTAVCPTPSTTTSSDCEDRMLWMLGKVITEDETDVDTDTRWTVGDVLHSSPVTITYGGSDSDSDGVVDVFFDKIIFGTNDGGLRMVNADTGKEDWIFLPQETIDLQQSLYVNPEGDHTYAIDLTPIVKINDVDKDGTIEPSDGDTVHAYVGMRRGGKFVYALDLTATVTSSGSPVVPKFLWRIEGGVASSDFEYLADTWSQPVLASILTTTGPQDVLIFGGGYDTALDSTFGTAGTTPNDNQGNMIFVVNAADGSLIFSIGGSNTNATLKVPEMQFSLAAKPAVLDTSGDGNQNRVYIADTGGQVWRVDLASDIVFAGGAGSTVVGRLASVSTEGTAADERRFFETPEVAAVIDPLFTEASNSKYYLVAIGSGDRAHPLTDTVSDRVYGFRDFTIGDMTGGSGANSHKAQNYPQTSGVALNESNLVDVSVTVLDENDTTVDESFGWYLDFISMGNVGEKVLSNPIIIGGNIFITTYQPDGGNNLDACAANLGGGRLIGFDVLSTRGFTTDTVDRTISDDLRGIASSVIPFYSPDGIYGLIGVEGGVWQPDDPDDACEYGKTCDDGGLKLGENSGVLTYWSEE